MKDRKTETLAPQSDEKGSYSIAVHKVLTPFSQENERHLKILEVIIFDIQDGIQLYISLTSNSDRLFIPLLDIY